MNRSDAWERFAQCRRLQPDALQVLVSADIVDALLARSEPVRPSRQERRFWPGYDWRVLAHRRSAKGRKGAYTGQRILLSSEDFVGPVEFDELVIDHWFHLEQMDDRDWWMSVGGWHINVSIDADGRPHVSMSQDESPDEIVEHFKRRMEAA